MMREWIIFALCLGVGGHIALGVVMHAPGYWPWNTAALYGLLSGFAVYATVQALRAAWNWYRRSARHGESTDPGSLW